jgi:hypothetical protein
MDTPIERTNTPTGSVHSPTPPPQPVNPPIVSSMKRVEPPPTPWPTAPFAPGVDPKAQRKANKAYDSVVSNMLTEAQHKFELLLFVEDAYPKIDVQIRWSTECWRAVCLESERYFHLSKDMMNLVRSISTTALYPLKL